MKSNQMEADEILKALIKICDPNAMVTSTNCHSKCTFKMVFPDLFGVTIVVFQFKATPLNRPKRKSTKIHLRKQTIQYNTIHCYSTITPFYHIWSRERAK